MKAITVSKPATLDTLNIQEREVSAPGTGQKSRALPR